MLCLEGSNNNHPLHSRHATDLAAPYGHRRRLPNVLLSVHLGLGTFENETKIRVQVLGAVLLLVLLLQQGISWVPR